MIPQLYATDGATLLAYLSDATTCEVTEERNGIYELYLVLPTASAQFPLIENDCWIVAKPNDIGADQWFRVYQIEKTMRGTATVSAEHISYPQQKRCKRFIRSHNHSTKKATQLQVFSKIL
ncbi:MAG: hypothetical protein LBG83_03540 [Oscillospiraceae bacterium]|jgi:phage-related protein|nr:hypothetical protein [Oscillospiraceae bacterium]